MIIVEYKNVEYNYNTMVTKIDNNKFKIQYKHTSVDGWSTFGIYHANELIDAILGEKIFKPLFVAMYRRLKEKENENKQVDTSIAS